MVLDPVLEDKSQDSCSQLQEEDDTQEHGELKYVNSNITVNLTNTIKNWKRLFLRNMLDEETYKFEQEWVFSQRSNAASESEDEHHTTHHQEEPDWVKPSQVCDGRDVGEDTLIKQSEGLKKSFKVGPKLSQWPF